MRNDSTNDKRRRRRCIASMPLPAMIASGFVALVLLVVSVGVARRPWTSGTSVESPYTLRLEFGNPNREQAKTPNQTGPGKSDPPRKEGPTTVDPAPKAVEADDDIARRAGWSVTVDPPGPLPDFPDKSTRLSVPLPLGSRDVYLPTSASPYFAVGMGLKSPGATLWDLRTQSSVNDVPFKVELRRPHVLSPDGKYLAGRPNVAAAAVDVFQFSNGKVRRLNCDTGSDIKWLDFGTDSDTLVVAVATLANPVLQIWNLASGEKTLTIALPSKAADRPAFALSPGRQHVAVAAGKFVWVYRLVDGQLLGARPSPSGDEDQAKQSLAACEGLVFSPDGSELAGLFGGVGVRSRLTAWSIKSGERTHNHDITGMAGNSLPQLHSPADLDYAPDGRAWLVRDTFLIEHDTGAVLGRPRLQFPTGLRSPVRLLPNDQVLTIGKSANLKTDAVVTLPFDRQAYDAGINKVRNKEEP